MPIALAELILFLLTLPLMFKLGDLKTLLKPNNKNWALIIPLGATIGPLVSLGRGKEDAIPALLVIPSLFYIGLLTYSLFIWLRTKYTKNPDKLHPNDLV